MKKFIINKNHFLQRDIEAYYHGEHRNFLDTEVGFINTLKNDRNIASDIISQFGYTIPKAKEKLYEILTKDLKKIAEIYSSVKLTIVVVPRAKRNECYTPNQLGFLLTIKKFVNENQDIFYDGTEYMLRVEDTETTHLTRKYNSVYPGITEKTCFISEEVRGKDILLLDDIYTPSVNIDEDAIQALINRGANTVIFYAVGKTVYFRQSNLDNITE